MIGFLGNKKINYNKIRTHNNSRIIVLQAEIDDEMFLLINLCNPNTEAEQVKIFCELEWMLHIFSLDSYKNIFFAGDFNCFLNSNLEASGGNPALKKKSVSKLIQLLEKYNLIDIWRIRNPFSKRYTFRKNHFSGYIQRFLDYISVSNTLQESLQQTSILPSFCSVHSTILVSYNKPTKISMGKNFWKFNSSLVQDETFVLKLKEHIKHVKTSFHSNLKNNEHFQWEFLKYEIHKFTIGYSKNKAKLKREKVSFLEKKLKGLEQNLNNEETKLQYNSFKDELNDIYEEISNGTKIRSCCNWYELGEKSNKYFLNLEKSQARKNILHKICSKTQEITDLTKINTAIFDFYANLFKEKLKTNIESLNNFLRDLSIPSLPETQKQICEEELTEKGIYESMISFDNKKSPGNDGLTKEFYQTFWQDV